jgi:hypothetical protein
MVGTPGLYAASAVAAAIGTQLTIVAAEKRGFLFKIAASAAQALATGDSRSLPGESRSRITGPVETANPGHGTVCRGYPRGARNSTIAAVVSVREADVGSQLKPYRRSI